MFLFLVPIVSWFDLATDQREAAKLFGYTCHTWEYWLGPSNMGFVECVTPYYKRQWIGLPFAQKKAAKLLGYNETSWDGDTLELPEYWEELSDEQQALLGELGYNQGIYNDFFDYYYWNSLPSSVQTAAKTLHLNQDSWDRCDSSTPSDCNQLFWRDLDLKQKTAAGEVGLTCYDYDE